MPRIENAHFCLLIKAIQVVVALCLVASTCAAALTPAGRSAGNVMGAHVTIKEKGVTTANRIHNVAADIASQSAPPLPGEPSVARATERKARAVSAFESQTFSFDDALRAAHMSILQGHVVVAVELEVGRNYVWAFNSTIDAMPMASSTFTIASGVTFSIRRSAASGALGAEPPVVTCVRGATGTDQEVQYGARSPRFAVRFGGTFEIGGIVIEGCDGVLADVDDGAVLSVFDSTVFVSYCPEADLNFNISGVASFVRSEFVCGMNSSAVNQGQSDDEAQMRLVRMEQSAGDMPASRASALGGQGVAVNSENSTAAAVLINAHGMARVRVDGCRMERWAGLLSVKGNADAVVVASTITACSGACFHISSHASVSVTNSSRILAAEVADVRDAGLFTVSGSDVASARSAADSAARDFAQSRAPCDAFRTWDHARLVIVGSTLSLSGCRGLAFRDDSTALIDGVLIDAVDTSNVWTLEDSASLYVRWTSVIANSSVDIVGDSKDLSMVTLLETYVSAPNFLFMSGGARVDAHRLSVESWADPSIYLDDQNVIVLKESASGVFSACHFTGTNLAPIFQLCGRHTVGLRDDATLEVTDSSFVNMPGALYARESASARLSAVSISANTILPTGEVKLEWPQYASVKVCEGGAFLLEDNATLFVNSSALTALPLVSEGGGVGAFAGTSRALIINTTVDVAGGTMGISGGAFFLRENAHVNISHCKFDNLFTVAFYSMQEIPSKGGFAQLNDGSFLAVTDSTISSSRSYNGGLVHAQENSVAVVTRVSVGVSVAILSGGVFFVTHDAQLTITDVTVGSAFAGLSGGFVYAGNSAIVAIDSARMGDVEAYWGALAYAMGIARASLSRITVRSALCKTYQVSAVDALDENPRNFRAKQYSLLGEPEYSGCLVFGSSDAFVGLEDVRVSDSVTTQFAGAVFGLKGSSKVYAQSILLAAVTAGRNGGVAQVLDMSVLEIGGLFVANVSVVVSGGIVSATGSATVSVDDFSIEQAFARQGGGCVHAAGTANVTLSRGRISSALTDGPGAVLLASGSSLVYLDAIAVKSASASKGGVLAVSDAVTVVAVNLAVDQSVALTDGGCATVEGSATATIVDSTFQSCTSGSRGGSVYAGANAVVRMANVTFLASRALEAGGFAAVVGSATIDMAHVSVSRSSSSRGDGGCIAADGTADVRIDDSEFHSTSAPNNGGFMSVGGDALSALTGVRVMSSSCNGRGGVISASERASINITLCTFSNATGKKTGGFVSATYAASIRVHQTSVVRAWSDAGVPGLFVRGVSRVDMHHVRLSHVLRPFWPGEGWISAAPGSVSLDDVVCDGCTADSLLSADYSLVGAESLVFANLTDIPDIGSDKERLVTLLSSLRADRPLRLRFPSWNRPVYSDTTIDTNLPFALSNVELERSAVVIRGVGAINFSSFIGGSSLTIGELAHAAIDYLDMTDSSVTIDGHAQFVHAWFKHSRLFIGTVGIFHCQRCTISSDTFLRRTSSNDASAGDVLTFVVLSRLSYAAFNESTIGDWSAVGNGGFARVSGSSILHINGGTVGSLQCSGDGGFVSAEVDPSDAVATSLVSVSGVRFGAPLSAGGHGGFVSLRGFSQAVIADCIFDSAVAGRSGGMAYLAESASLSMTRCNVSSAISLGSGVVGGGFVAILDAAAVLLHRVHVDDATAQSNGGFATISSHADGGDQKLPSLTAEDVFVGAVMAGDSGGGIECNRCRVSIVSGVFGGGSASDAGGLIHISGGTDSRVEFKRCVFDGFSTGVQGGLVSLADRSAVLFEECHVSNVQSVVYGGAVVMDAGTVVVTNSSFARTISLSGGGGSFLVRAGRLHVSDSVFTDTVAALNGGGFLLLEARGTAVLQNVTVWGGRCLLAGGGVLRLSGRALMTARGLIVRDAAAAGCGGVLLLDGIANATIDGLAVSGSTAEFSDGGAICIVGKGELCLSNSDIANPMAGSSGGAMSASGNATAILRGVTMRDTEARDGDGGAVYVAFGARVDMGNSTIDGALCSKRGGAIFAGSSAALSTETLVVRRAHAANGGLLYLADAATAIMRSTVAEDVSADENGGCIYASSGGLGLHGGTFSQCRASTLPSSYGRGGFLFADTHVTSLEGLTHLRVFGASSLSAPVVFTSNVLAQSQSVGRMFDSLGAYSAAFEAGNTSFASPITRFSVIRTTTNATVTLFPAHASGAALPEFSVEALDYYGNLAFAPPSHPLAIRFVVVIGSVNSSAGVGTGSSSGCTLSGDLRRTFSLSSRVDYSGIRLSTASLPAVCSLAFTPDNFLYDASSPLFQSFALSVNVSACDVGYERLANSTAPGTFYCSSIDVGGSSAPSSSGSNSGIVVVAVVVPVIVVCALVCAAAMFAIRRNRKRWNAKQMENFAQHVQTSMPGILSVELPEGSVTLCEQLGEGAFGVVHRSEVG